MGKFMRGFIKFNMSIVFMVTMFYIFKILTVVGLVVVLLYMINKVYKHNILKNEKVEIVERGEKPYTEVKIKDITEEEVYRYDNIKRRTR